MLQIQLLTSHIPLQKQDKVIVNGNYFCKVNGEEPCEV